MKLCIKCSKAYEDTIEYCECGYKFFEDDIVEHERSFYYKVDTPWTFLNNPEKGDAIKTLPDKIIFNSYMEMVSKKAKWKIISGMAVSLYVSMIDSFMDDDIATKIDYMHSSGNYYLRIAYFKKNKLWLAEKYKGTTEKLGQYINTNLDSLLHHIVISGYK